MGFGAVVGEFDTNGLTTMNDGDFDVLLAPDETTAPAPINAATEAPTFKAVDDVTRGRTLLIIALAIILNPSWSTFLYDPAEILFHKTPHNMPVAAEK